MKMFFYTRHEAAGFRSASIKEGPGGPEAFPTESLGTRLSFSFHSNNSEYLFNPLFSLLPIS